MPLNGSLRRRDLRKIGKNFSCLRAKNIQAYLRDVVGLVPDHCNKANIAIKQVTNFFGFPVHYKSYVYTIL